MKNKPLRKILNALRIALVVIRVLSGPILLCLVKRGNEKQIGVLGLIYTLALIIGFIRKPQNRL